MLMFAVIGIVLAIAGYKLFDKCTPGDLNKLGVYPKGSVHCAVADRLVKYAEILKGETAGERKRLANRRRK